MTKRELNRDVKKLYNEYTKALLNDNYYSWLLNTGRPELRRLYGADKEFEYLTKDNLLRLMKMNLSIVVIPLHQFGLFIKI